VQACLAAAAKAGIGVALFWAMTQIRYNYLTPRFGLKYADYRDPRMLWFAGLTQLGAALVGMLLYLLLVGRRRRPFGLNLNRAAAFVSTAGVFLIALGYAVLIIVSRWCGAISWRLADTANPTYIWRALALGVLAGVMEEFYFRGFLFNAVLDCGRASAYVLSGAAFGLLHFLTEPFNLVRLTFLLVAAFTYTFIYDETRSIWPGVAFHAAFDFGSFLLVSNIPGVSIYWVNGSVSTWVWGFSLVAFILIADIAHYSRNLNPRSDKL
jgi:membrane protease YdiL (CAAX protease family)